MAVPSNKRRGLRVRGLSEITRLESDSRIELHSAISSASGEVIWILKSKAMGPNWVWLACFLIAAGQTVSLVRDKSGGVLVTITLLPIVEPRQYLAEIRNGLKASSRSADFFVGQGWFGQQPVSEPLSELRQVATRERVRNRRSMLPWVLAGALAVSFLALAVLTQTRNPNEVSAPSDTIASEIIQDQTVELCSVDEEDRRRQIVDLLESNQGQSAPEPTTRIKISSEIGGILGVSISIQCGSASAAEYLAVVSAQNKQWKVQSLRQASEFVLP